MYDFAYHCARSLDDALSMLRGSEDGKLLAGGHTLLPVLKQRLSQYSDLVDLGAVTELKGICRDGGAVVIGAMTTHAEVADSPEIRNSISGLATLAAGIGDPQVRNRGTLGGSIVHNDPAADYPAAVLALNATVRTNARSINADDFFTGMFETALEAKEIITAVSFPVPEKAGYVKFPNPASGYPIVGVFVARMGGAVRVAVTGAGACVFRVPEMEQALTDTFASEALSDITVGFQDLNADLHASAEYRAHLVTVMAKRAVAAAG